MQHKTTRKKKNLTPYHLIYRICTKSKHKKQGTEVTVQFSKEDKLDFKKVIQKNRSRGKNKQTCWPVGFQRDTLSGKSPIPALQRNWITFFIAVGMGQPKEEFQMLS